jgi:hypothetical protein
MRKDLESKIEEEKKRFEQEKIKVNQQIEDMEEKRQYDQRKMKVFVRKIKNINELRNLQLLQMQSLQQTQPKPSFFSVPKYNGGSIVDALKSIGANSSYNFRSSIAAKNGIGDYKGKTNENNKMLKLLKEGKLKMP